MNGTDIQVNEILKYMPHRPPMIWMSEVKRFSKVDGECRVHLRPDGLYMSPNGLRATACLEFVAQAYGFISACYITRVLDPKAKGMERAMLVSFKDARFAPPEVFAAIKGGETLRVPISGVRDVGPITAFHGEVWLGEVRLAEVQMRTFCE